MIFYCCSFMSLKLRRSPFDAKLENKLLCFPKKIRYPNNSANFPISTYHSHDSWTVRDDTRRSWIKYYINISNQCKQSSLKRSMQKDWMVNITSKSDLIFIITTSFYELYYSTVLKVSILWTSLNCEPVFFSKGQPNFSGRNFQKRCSM